MEIKRYNKEGKKQLTMSLISDELGQVSTKKEFLGITEKLIPWSQWVAETLMPSAKEALKSAYYELAEENWAAFCSHNTSDEGTPIFLEMNVTSEDVGLNLTYLREPENSPRQQHPRIHNGGWHDIYLDCGGIILIDKKRRNAAV